MDEATAVAIKTAPAWRPESGEILTAAVAKILRAETQYGEYPKVVFARADGTYVAWHAFHETAKEALKKRRPAPGDTLTVHYGGQIASRKRRDSSGNPVKYHAWTIVSEDDASDEWSFDSDAASDKPGF